jgi:hypothetical protein
MLSGTFDDILLSLYFQILNLFTPYLVIRDESEYRRLKA